MGTPTRRAFLGLGTTAVATLAGCGGGPGPTDTGGRAGKTGTPTPTAIPTRTATATPTSTPTATPMPTSLAIENVHFCAERPTGYREYAEQPDATYDPGDVVWVYLEPSTVGTRSAGAGELQFSYELKWTVYGPDSERVKAFSDVVEKTVPESSALSTVFLVFNFAPPMEFEPGTHRLEVQVRDRIAGNTVTEDIEFSVAPAVEQAEGSFGVPEIVFTESKASGYGEYTRQPGAEYGPTDTVWYYYEVDGVHYEETSDAKVLDLSIHETLTGPEGDTWLEGDVPLSNEFSPDTDLSTYYVVDGASPRQEWLTGEYTIELEVTDGYTDETVEGTGTFTVAE